MTSKKEISKRSLKLLKPFLSNFDFGWEMELVITLHNDRDRSWTSLELSQQLQIDERALNRSLLKLVEKGLIVEKDHRFYYGPKTSEKNALVELMIHAFAQRKLEVIRSIYESD